MSWAWNDRRSSHVDDYDHLISQMFFPQGSLVPYHHQNWEELRKSGSGSGVFIGRQDFSWIVPNRLCDQLLRFRRLAYYLPLLLVWVVESRVEMIQYWWRRNSAGREVGQGWSQCSAMKKKENKSIVSCGFLLIINEFQHGRKKNANHSISKRNNIVWR